MATDQEIDRVVLAVAKQLRSGFALVAIDGPGGSGKSALAAELAERLGALGQITIVHGDDFYRPMPAEDRLLLGPQDGYTQYFDWQRLRDQVLIPLTKWPLHLPVLLAGAKIPGEWSPSPGSAKPIAGTPR